MTERIIAILMLTASLLVIYALALAAGALGWSGVLALAIWTLFILWIMFCIAFRWDTE